MELTLFDFMDDYKRLKITKPIRLIELFAGIGSQAMALKRIGANFETYRVVEFDKYAIASYNAIHGTSFPTMDVTKIHAEDLGITDTDKYEYIMFYSFPCTDLSVAGKMAGMEEGSGTRSSLLWEVKRIIEECEELPQILIMENVTQVHSEENMPSFKRWLRFLEDKGYSSYWQDLNAMNYGVAQSRNRTFVVSILGKCHYKFPEPIPLEKSMKDYLEDEVDEKYYIKNEKAKELINKLIVGGKILTDRQTDRQSTYRLKNQTQSSGRIALRQDMMPESATTIRKGVVLLNMTNVNLSPDAEIRDHACTIYARDCRGLSNYGTNGAIEWNKLD